MRKLFFSGNPPGDCYLVMQREAAEKLIGIPRETLFALLLKPWFELRIIHNFQRTDFFPTPTVDIVMLRIKRRGHFLVTPELASIYEDFIVYVLRRGKPTIKGACKGILTYRQFRKLSKELGFSYQATPSELTFHQWLGLFQYFTGTVDRSRQTSRHGAGKRLRPERLHHSKLFRTHRRRYRYFPLYRMRRPSKSGMPVL
jgi:23S rRNA (adenine-N6)-dimethyltransferase